MTGACATSTSPIPPGETFSGKGMALSKQGAPATAS